MKPNSDINYYLMLLVPLLAIGATTSCGLLGADGDSPARPDTTSSNFAWSADTHILLLKNFKIEYGHRLSI